jgi:hypothetical protein
MPKKKPKTEWRRWETLPEPKKKEKTEWRRWETLPEKIRPVALSYSKWISGVWQGNNVVRLATDDRLFVQYYGRLCAWRLAALEKEIGCLVEIEALAPHYTLIMIFTYTQPPADPPNVAVNRVAGFLFREI